MGDRSSSSILSDLSSESISAQVEQERRTSSLQPDLSDDWDRGDEPARQVLQKVEFERAARMACEVKSDLEQILNRVDQVYLTYEHKDDEIFKNIFEQSKIEVISDLDELKRILDDPFAKSQFEKKATVFIVGFETGLAERDLLLNQINMFFMHHRNLEQEFQDLYDEDDEDYNDGGANPPVRDHYTSRAAEHADGYQDADADANQVARPSATKHARRLSSNALDLSAEAMHSSLAATAELGQNLQQLHERVVRVLMQRKALPDKTKKKLEKSLAKSNELVAHLERLNAMAKDDAADLRTKLTNAESKIRHDEIEAVKLRERLEKQQANHEKAVEELRVLVATSEAERRAADTKLQLERQEAAEKLELEQAKLQRLQIEREKTEDSLFEQEKKAQAVIRSQKYDTSRTAPSTSLRPRPARTRKLNEVAQVPPQAPSTVPAPPPPLPRIKSCVAEEQQLAAEAEAEAEAGSSEHMDTDMEAEAHCLLASPAHDSDSRPAHGGHSSHSIRCASSASYSPDSSRSKRSAATSRSSKDDNTKCSARSALRNSSSSASSTPTPTALSSAASSRLSVSGMKGVPDKVCSEQHSMRPLFDDDHELNPKSGSVQCG